MQDQIPLSDWTLPEAGAHFSNTFKFEIFTGVYTIMRPTIKTFFVFFMHFPQ